MTFLQSILWWFKYEPRPKDVSRGIKVCYGIGKTPKLPSRYMIAEFADDCAIAIDNEGQYLIALEPLRLYRKISSCACCGRGGQIDTRNPIYL